MFVGGTENTESTAFVRRTQKALARQRYTCVAPDAAAEAVFCDIVEQATNTSFGDDHGLSPKVRTLRDWKRAVPIRSYSDYDRYLQQLLRGESAILTQDAPYALLRTSGTSGQPKIVPTTRRWRSRYRSPALYAQWGLYFEHLAMRELNEDSVLDLSWTPAIPTEYRGEFPIYSITQRPLPRSLDDWCPPWQDASWFSGADRAAAGTHSAYRLLRRLAGREVKLVVSVNPSKITSLAECLNDHSETLIRDLHDGTALGEPATAVRPNPDLARRLDRVRQAHGRLRLTDIWPQLSLRVCWNSGGAALYQPWLDRIAPGTKQVPFSCTGTEGIVTIPVDDHPTAGPLAIDQGIFEFVPWDDLEDGSPLPADVETLDHRELKIGCRYRLVMSQANGLYRYDVGDAYEVVGKVGYLPRLEFLGRTGFNSSFTGEKLTDTDVYTAVCRALKVEPQDCPIFTCVPMWGEPPSYVLVVELSTQTRAIDEHELAVRVDQALQRLNVEYGDKRSSGRLAQTAVMVLREGSFSAIMDRRIATGASPAQIKHQWLQKDAALLTELGKLFPHAVTSVAARRGARAYRDERAS
ncbi:GH3 auxin-responsive promoter family protein [Streptomyces sp. NPDC001127]|uniref:GH3 auxin-responsive promoter family protein n=1 Tax=Streptomyces sp. NPDC001127 TaxID=3154377 RepID=UPI0033301A99